LPVVPGGVLKPAGDNYELHLLEAEFETDPVRPSTFAAVEDTQLKETPTLVGRALSGTAPKPSWPLLFWPHDQTAPELSIP
jgi:hypothetical protein